MCLRQHWQANHMHALSCQTVTTGIHSVTPHLQAKKPLACQIACSDYLQKRIWCNLWRHGCGAHLHCASVKGMCTSLLCRNATWLELLPCPRVHFTPTSRFPICLANIPPPLECETRTPRIIAGHVFPKMTHQRSASVNSLRASEQSSMRR